MKELILTLLALVSLQVTTADQPACKRAMDLGYEIMQFVGNNYYLRRISRGENEKLINEIKDRVGNFTVAGTDIDDKEQRDDLGCKVFAAKTFDDVFQLVSLPEEISQYVTKDQICSWYIRVLHEYHSTGLADKNRRKNIFSYLSDLITWMYGSGFPDIPIRGGFEDNLAALQALRDNAPNEMIVSQLQKIDILPLGVFEVYTYNEDYSEFNITKHSFDTEDLVKYMTESSSIYGYLAELFKPDWFHAKSVYRIGDMISFLEMAKWEGLSILYTIEEFLNIVMDKSNIANLDTSACVEPDYTYNRYGDYNYDNGSGYGANYTSVN